MIGLDHESVSGIICPAVTISLILEQESIQYQKQNSGHRDCSRFRVDATLVHISNVRLSVGKTFLVGRYHAV